MRKSIFKLVAVLLIVCIVLVVGLMSLNEDTFKSLLDKVMVTNNQVYSLNEVATHDTADDCYMVVNGLVVDVTSFISWHPGGSEVIVDACGKDASEMFNSVSGHSENLVYLLLKIFKVGVLTEK